jgi:type IV secretory pathway TraG/TraD family ATPase VirD4
MTAAEGGSRIVWILLEELGSLQKLPNLAQVITAGRDFNIRLVVGFTGRNQIDAFYGTEAETLLSQPRTKIFLRTSKPQAAEWISQALGEVEIERLKERDSDSSPTYFEGKRKRKTFQRERRVEQLVLPSEITGLGDHTGYLKLGDLVVKADFSYVEAERKQPGFIPRPLPVLEPLPVPSVPPVAARTPASPPSDPSNATEEQTQKPQNRDDVPPQIVFD